MIVVLHSNLQFSKIMGGRKEKSNLDNCLELSSIYIYDFFGFTDRPNDLPQVLILYDTLYLLLSDSIHKHNLTSVKLKYTTNCYMRSRCASLLILHKTRTQIGKNVCLRVFNNLPSTIQVQADGQPWRGTGLKTTKIRVVYGLYTLTI